MKKTLAWLLAFVMVLAVTGCSAPAATAPTAEAPAAEAPTAEAPPADAPASAAPAAEAPAADTKDYSNMKVVALLSGVITDNGWNQICYESVKNLEDKYGVPCEYIESIAVSDMAEYLRAYGEDGYDMVIVHGSQFEAAVAEVADSYPNTHFCLSYGFRVNAGSDVNLVEKPNLAYVGPVNMGVVIGSIMGVLTDTNKVVFLGGQDIPAITDIVSGIEEGVRLTNKEAEVVTDYLGTLTDADKAKEVALTYINAGFDVISASANSAQLGCLYAAEEKGVYALGFNGDQYGIAPEAVVLSVMRNYPAIYEDVFLAMAEGNWQSGMIVYDLSQNGTLVSDWHGWDTKLPAEKVQRINDTLQKLFAGELGDY